MWWNRWVNGWTIYFRSHETDRRDDSMGNRTTAIFDGNCCFCIDGYGVNSSDQFSSTWNYFESFWNCRRSSNDWVLCTDDRICDGQFTGEWNWRSIGTGNRNIDVTGSQYCKKTIDLAATDHYKCHSWSDLYCSFKNDE